MAMKARNPEHGTGPGLILSTMVALCIGLITIPVVGTPMLLYRWGMLPPFALLTLFTSLSNVAMAFFLPRALLFVLALTFIIAFLLRANWGPRVLSVMALLWAVATGLTTMLVPMFAMPGGLPLITALNMVPAMISPVLFSLGFTGFLLNSDSAHAWFSRPDAKVLHA